MMIWTETATVWTFGGRRYLNKYACVRAYCVERMMIDRFLDGYDNEAHFRMELIMGSAGDDSKLLERYYRWCLTAIRTKVQSKCSHNLPPGCCLMCVSEREAHNAKS